MIDEQEQQEKLQLPFSAGKQDAVLGYLLRNQRFFDTCRHKIEPTWFVDLYAGKVWKARLKYQDEHGHAPAPRGDGRDEFTETGEFVLEDEQERRKMTSKVEVAHRATANFSLDVLQKELQGWYQAVLFKAVAGKSAHLFNNKRFDECYTLMSDEIERIRSARFVEDMEYDWNKVEADINAMERDRERACTLGHELLDRTLLPDAPEGTGSLLPGDQTIILAATNTGKTRSLNSIIRHNVQRQKNVLWLAHEGRESDLSMNLWCAMLNCTQVRFMELIRTPEGRHLIDLAREKIRRHVVFIPYMKAGMTVEDVVPIIRNKCEEFAAKHQGRGFDLFVSDYPAKLSTKQASHGHMQMRHILDIVYNYHVNLALEYKFHSLVAYQTNRAGAQVQKGQKDDGRLLTKEDAAEAYGPMQTAANVITLNRPEELKARGWVTWYFDKSRTGETGWAVTCKSDFARALTHAPKLDAVKLKTNSSMVERMDQLWDQYRNGTVPEEALATG